MPDAATKILTACIPGKMDRERAFKVGVLATMILGDASKKYLIVQFFLYSEKWEFVLTL